MAGMNKSLVEYEQNGGWSSKLFAKQAVALMAELAAQGVDVKIGRTVIHIKKNKKTLKAYVHHNGRSEEYATITDSKGVELLTVHYKDFEQLSQYIKDTLCL
jgi:ribosomal protein S18